MKPDSEKRISSFQDSLMIDLRQEGKPNSEISGGFKAPRFSPRTALIGLTKYGITGIAGYYSSGLLESVALVGAKLAIDYHFLSGQDPKLAVAVLALSYVPLVMGSLANAEQAWKSLNETGVSVSPLAKVGYDLSRKGINNERIQKVATIAGFCAFELVKEIPWYLGAYKGDWVASLVIDHVPFVGQMFGSLIAELVPTHTINNEELGYLTGANIFGAGYQYAQAGSVEVVLKGIRNRKRIMNIFRRSSKRI